MNWSSRTENSLNLLLANAIQTLQIQKFKNIYIKANAYFHVIPYFHSPMLQLFPHMSMLTMTTFPGTSLIIKKINWVE